MRSLLVTILLLIPATVSAQPTRVQKTADWLSYGTLAATVPLACEEWRSKECAWTAAGYGLDAIVTELVKRAVHRERPDGTDDKSFWSGHTALCFAALDGKYKWQVLGLCSTTAVLRVVARNHHPTDVLAGAGAGIGFALTIGRRGR
jgi:membrane-associated phospholipid phosphatase